jgi:hypothetical protein
MTTGFLQALQRPRRYENICRTGGYTKHPRRIEPGDIIRQWRAAQLTVAQIRAEKAKLPVAP